MPTYEYKYKPCCDRRCLLGNCKNREKGACYCCCRLLDHINNLENVIKGESIHPNVWIPDENKRKEFYDSNKEECDDYISNAPRLLQEAREILKKYEI